jgi:hydrogenase expression/formation protein HypC
MQIISIDDTQAVCEIDGVKREASLMMLDDAKIGDFVLIHAGFAIEKLDQTEAEKTLELFREVLADGGLPT